MKTTSLRIENNRINAYKSQFVVDKLARNNLMATAIMVMNIYEYGESFQIKLASSGFAKKNYTIEVKGGNLFIHALKFARSNNLKPFQCSFGTYSFSKSFAIPANVDTANITSLCIEGVLIIDLPKNESLNSRS